MIRTKENMMNTLISKCETQDTETLKEVVIGLSDRFEEGSTSAFIAALNVLETRMDSESFVTFCEEEL
jgi:hypothetical protein